MLCGGDSMLDLERLRADEAGAELRAVAEVPAERRRLGDAPAAGSNTRSAAIRSSRSTWVRGTRRSARLP